MFLNCSVGEVSVSPLDCKEIQPVHSEGDQPWDFFGRNDAEAETPVHWPPHAKSWLIGKDGCWEGLGAGGEGDNRGWDSWMALPTQWTWVWVSSKSWWQRKAWRAAVHGVTESDTTEQLNWLTEHFVSRKRRLYRANRIDLKWYEQIMNMFFS